MHERCVNFIFKLVTELKNRLRKNFCILQTIKELSVANTLRVIKPDILNEELTKLLNVSANTIDQIETQWQNITSQ